MNNNNKNNNNNNKENMARVVLLITITGWIAPEVWNEESEFEEKSDLYSAAFVILCWLSKIIKKTKKHSN